MRNFINENNLNFTVGSRNSLITILIGYALYKGLTKDELKTELGDEIANDSFIGEEVDRLFNYCKDRNYGKFWSSEDAKLQYTF